MRLIRGLILLVLVVVVAAVSADGPAGAEESRTSEQEHQAVHDEFCDHPGPCRVVNGLADPKRSDVGAERPPPLYESLRQHGRPAEDCPDAAKYYGAEGRPVDAFLGACPEVPPDGSAGGGR